MFLILILIEPNPRSFLAALLRMTESQVLHFVQDDNSGCHPERCLTARRIRGKRPVILSNAKDLFLILIEPNPRSFLAALLRMTSKSRSFAGAQDDKKSFGKSRFPAGLLVDKVLFLLVPVCNVFKLPQPCIEKRAFFAHSRNADFFRYCDAVSGFQKLFF